MFCNSTWWKSSRRGNCPKLRVWFGKQLSSFPEVVQPKCTWTKTNTAYFINLFKITSKYAHHYWLFSTRKNLQSLNSWNKLWILVNFSYIINKITIPYRVSSSFLRVFAHLLFWENLMMAGRDREVSPLHSVKQFLRVFAHLLFWEEPDDGWQGQGGESQSPPRPTFSWT